MSKNTDNIAAIATSIGQGGIGVVRISGNNLVNFALEIVGRDLIPRQATYTHFLDIESKTIDWGIAIYFPKPNSFTGEDVLELQAHGGQVVLNMLLRRCIQLGARIANPGEFSQRAYLNNKIDLLQAESIADLISANSEQAVRCANRSLSGEFSNYINQAIEKLIKLRMLVEATLDFPEEDLGDELNYSIELSLMSLQDEIDTILKNATQGSILRNGAHIVLVGSPNVGKSSLLNSLAKEEVAIVSEIAGTTRDIIRQMILINGIPFYLIDTAGLRKTSDAIEIMGMERTKLALKKADAVLIIRDTLNKSNEEHSAILDLIPNNIPKINVVNKMDLIFGAHLDSTNVEVYVSAKTGEGIEDLRNLLLKSIGWESGEGAFIARERHIQALELAKSAIERAHGVRISIEIFAEELRYAQIELSKITGDFTSDDLLGEIFSKFCIGK